MSPRGMKLLTILAGKKPSEAFLADWIKMALVGMDLVGDSCQWVCKFCVKQHGWNRILNVHKFLPVYMVSHHSSRIEVMVVVEVK